MFELSDEVIMAFADGELPPAERARVERAIAADRALGERVALFQATRVTLQRAYAPVLSAPIPDRLLDAIYKTPMPSVPAVEYAPGAGARLGLLQRLRELLGLSGGATLRVGLGYAAALALGLGFGIWSAVEWRRADTQEYALVAMGPGGMVAGGALARALESAPSGHTVADRGLAMTPVLSFRAKDQRVCRQYELGLEGGAAVAGFACRDTSGTWAIKVQTAAAAGAKATVREGQYRPAGRDAVAILEAAIGDAMHGDVLLAEDEARLIARGWK